VRPYDPVAGEARRWGVRFGILTFCRGPFERFPERWRRIEELGFDSAWLNDDVLTPGWGDYEPWTALGALAASTSRLRLGTMVSVPLYRHPSFLAAQVLTLDHISGGRVELGFGAGGGSNPFGAFSQPIWSPRELIDRLDEQAAIVGSLLRGEPTSFAGTYYQVEDAQPPVPVQSPRPPLRIAAHGERGMRVVARYADGWNSLGGQPGDPDVDRIPLADAVANVKALSDRLDAICAEEGRDPATLHRSTVAFRPGPDPFGSVDAFDEFAGRYGEIGIDELIFYWPPLDLAQRGESPSAADEARFERIATERVLGVRSQESGVRDE
jgi:alkanesulfonate monooxygenase SsuD/methylene tetrahydromethanopterin reductase-like flavin-dependent oxidoreductase (luciferase family)